MSRSKKGTFKVPQSLLKSIATIQHEKEVEDRQWQAAQAAKALEQARLQHELREGLKREGLPYAQKIFAWATDFQKDTTGRKLLALGEKRNSYVEGVYFFDGHVHGFAWRGLGVSCDGLWWIRTGCGGPSERYVKSPLELAEQIHPLILKAAWESIETGAVWNCIKERLT